MKRIKLILLGLILALGVSAGVTACSGSGGGAYYDSICVDPYTQIRMPDTYCMTSPSWWYYVPYGYMSPGYYGHISNYNINLYRRPSNATVHVGGLSSSGGRATRYSTGNTSYSRSGAVVKSGTGTVSKGGSGSFSKGSSGTGSFGSNSTKRSGGFGGSFHSSFHK